MDETLTGQDALYAAAAPSLKAGYRIESQAPGVLVLVAPKMKLPVGFMLLLCVVTFGIWIPVWLFLASLPRVNRVTFTLGGDGAVVKSRSWRAS
jgi:hypothetical protein